MTRAVVRRANNPTNPKGSITVRGDLLTSPPVDILDAAAGITVEVHDSLNLSRTFAWTASECARSSSGRITCMSADRAWKARFSPFKSAPQQFKFTLTLHRLDTATPFQAPVTVDVSQGPLVAGVDRVGSINLCASTNSGIRCRLP